MADECLSWEELSAMASPPIDRTEGPTNAHATLRLFGQSESNIRVTLYRDHHAWCPYCQKVWLWLEFKKIPYRIRKVTMRCYGPKEKWFTAKVPSGMLPALELDGNLITESDVILLALEKAFGALGASLEEPRVVELRRLERQLFRAWCVWLCTPGLNNHQEKQARAQFKDVARRMETVIDIGGGTWMDPQDATGPIPGCGDVVFIPYVERMNASLAYYKGFSLRTEHPSIDRWLAALEDLETYRGTQSDFHTHAHDLPPQMGGCYEDMNTRQQEMVQTIDQGEGLGELECKWAPDQDSHPELRALERVLYHRNTLMTRNPLGVDLDQPMRAALTFMVSGKPVKPAEGSALGIRYLRDRISVPRDMPLYSARYLRQALEATAALDSPRVPERLPLKQRHDQDPRPFLKI
eukprot:m.28214 g.28214  ORF g.28214 m.28214 type:complete len:409 (-) comp7982_c0_seq3:1223-2449(-)